MSKIKDVVTYLEDFAPISYQEDYDNSGLITGDIDQEVTGILICLDSTEEVVDEAVNQQCNLIIAHHPIIFKGLNKITGRNHVEKTIIKAIRSETAIYASHTNLDNIKQGVNQKIAEVLGLDNTVILLPKQDKLMKLVSFVPADHTDLVLDALHSAGAGMIGNYEHCSFRVQGFGRFRPGEAANPYIGKKDLLEEVTENRIEVIFPDYKKDRILQALNQSHPYEEVAYYLHELNNYSNDVGSGMMGDLPAAMTPDDFLQFLKKTMKLENLRYTPSGKTRIKKVAVCGGAGSFLLKNAKMAGADAFITADIRYHDYFETEGKILLIDIGHYESEQYTKELIYHLLSKKFSNIALRLSEVNTNPIRYI